MRLDHDLRVLVIDGSRMLLLRNQGDDVYPDLKVDAHRQFHNPAAHELRSGAPGVGFDRSHPGRHTFEEGDPHQANEDRFVLNALEAIETDLAGNGASLLIVAPPRALATLRQHYSRATRSALIGEVAKDLSKHPVEAITNLLRDYPQPDRPQT